MALALGEYGDQHIGAGHFLAPRGLHMNHRALDDALEARGGLGILGAVGDKVVQFGFEIGDEASAQLFEIDVARPHDRGSVLVLDQREQKMLKRCVFVVPLIGERQGPMKRLFEAARERWHSMSLHFVLDDRSPGLTFFP